MYNGKNFQKIKEDILNSFFLPKSIGNKTQDMRQKYWVFLPGKCQILLSSKKKYNLRGSSDITVLNVNGSWENIYSSDTHCLVLCNKNMSLLLSLDYYIEECRICKRTSYDLKDSADIIEYENKLYCEDCYEVHIETECHDKNFNIKQLYPQKKKEWKQGLLFV